MLLTQNNKMKKASLKTWNFDLPAIKTCPFADKCKTYCYATKGFYKMPVVKRKQEANLKASKSDLFIHLMNHEIGELKAKNKIDAVRIHSSGDFYNQEYLDKWIKIVEINPDIMFYAYTKSLPYFDKYHGTRLLPDNFSVIFSEGGKFDHLINARGLRKVSLVDSYSSNALTSDSDDSMIVFSNENIELIKRAVR